jgi:polyhydroxyalkanoate synthesis regulator phasin
MEGIKEIIPIDPLKIKKVRKLKKEMDKGANGTPVQLVKDIEEFYVYTNTDKESYIMTGPQGLHLSLDSVVYVPSGLVDLNSKRVLGYLHKAIRPLNMLRQMEDALLVYRIARAPERRVFYVDVGQLPKQKAEQYMRDMMSRFRTRLIYNQDTGEIRDERKFMSVLEDYWLPRREGSRGTEITTLPGAQSLSQIEDAEYFKKKLYGALNVPLSRLQPESNGFNMGRSTEITREEIKFYKFVDRLRFQFSKLFMDTLRVQLLLKGVMTDDDWRELKTDIKFVFNTDNYFWDLKEAEILAERLKMLSYVEPYIGKYFSTDYVKTQILRYLPEELKELEKQMATDRQRIAQEQAALAAQQAAQGQPQG